MTKMQHDEGWDAVVIGSGIGGLATAVLLARLHGKRVLVLEKHYRTGGYTHTFSRKGYHWDVGVHYIGNVGEGGGERDLFDVITGADVAWTSLPERFERLVFPDFEFTIRAGKERYRADLHAAFPNETRAIDRYFADIECAAGYIRVLGLRSTAPRPLASLAKLVSSRARRLAFMTTGRYLERTIADPRLRAILSARWGDYGEPPCESAFLAHAVITAHYFNGGYYPVGSSASLAAAATRALEAAGGEVRIRAEVDRILMANGHAVGVRLVSGEELRTPVVISDAGARNTYLRLLPPDVPLSFRSELASMRPSRRFVTLFLGLSASPTSLGVFGENIWIHGQLDHDEMSRRAASTLDGKPPLAYVSFPSLKDPQARAHTGEIVGLVDDEAFSRFAGTRWMKRGPDYDALKEQVAEGLLSLAERHIPGLRNLVAYRELSTPLSAEHFTGHPGGESYGIPAIPERYAKEYLSARTPVPGLYLTGADALTLGVAGAARAGQMCAAAIAGPASLIKIGSEAKRLRAGKQAKREAKPPSTVETRD